MALSGVARAINNKSKNPNAEFGTKMIVKKKK